MGKSSFSGYFAEAGVNALNGVGGIHYAAYSTAIIKKLLHMHPVSLPYTNGSRILFSIFLEPVKFGNGCFEIDGTINFLKLGGKSFVILGRNVLDGIADKVHDAALYHYLREDSLCSFFQSRNTVHADESHIFDTAGLISSKICIQLCFPSVSLLHKPKTSLMPSKS